MTATGLLAELAVGVLLGLVYGVLPVGDDRRDAGGRLVLPASHGARPGLWLWLVRGRPGRRRPLAVAPILLVLYVAAGLLRLAAILVRVLDLAGEHLARSADDRADY